MGCIVLLAILAICEGGRFVEGCRQGVTQQGGPFAKLQALRTHIFPARCVLAFLILSSNQM